MSSLPLTSSSLLKGPGKRGHIVADTLLLMMFLGRETRGTQNECCVSMLRKLGNICCGHKMFLNKIRNIFWVTDTKFVPATNVAHEGKRGNICVGNNVSSFARALSSLLSHLCLVEDISTWSWLLNYVFAFVSLTMPVKFIINTMYKLGWKPYGKRII